MASTWRTRYWVQYRKSRYRGASTYKRYFKSIKSLQDWRSSHPNSHKYTELAVQA